MPAFIMKAAVLVIMLQVSCQEMETSKSAIKAMISEDESRGIYRLENKNEMKQFSRIMFEELKIFCHPGQAWSTLTFWILTDMIVLKIESDDYNVYMAKNSSSVQKLYHDHQTTWFYSSPSWKPKRIKLNPFESTCVGILTREEFSITLHKNLVNYWQVLKTIAVLILFYIFPKLFIY